MPGAFFTASFQLVVTIVKDFQNEHLVVPFIRLRIKSTSSDTICVALFTSKKDGKDHELSPKVL